MKTFTVFLICIGLVAASANSKIRKQTKKRQIGNCVDTLSNCISYDKSICSDAHYHDWVNQNCKLWCGHCSDTGSFPLPATGHVTGTGACTDKISNCADYTQAVCTNSDYATWVLNNCAHYCNKCGGTVSAPGGTVIGTACADVATNCAMLNRQAHICSDSGAGVYAQQNCAKTCNLCGGSTGNIIGAGPGHGTMPGVDGTCHDAIANCNAYDPSVCTSADYKQWATQNCAATCHLCSSITNGGSMQGGTVIGGMMMATESSGTITGSGSGCVYNSHLYQQGETWKDGCKFNCQCVDGSTGKYQCTQLCVQWQLPTQCHMNPPAPGKCCKTPSCPAGFNIQYPQGYTEQ